MLSGSRPVHLSQSKASNGQACQVDSIENISIDL